MPRLGRGIFRLSVTDPRYPPPSSPVVVDRIWLAGKFCKLVIPDAFVNVSLIYAPSVNHIVIELNKTFLQLVFY